MGEAEKIPDHRALGFVFVWALLLGVRETLAQTLPANEGLRLALATELGSSLRNPPARVAGPRARSGDRRPPVPRLILARELLGGAQPGAAVAAPGSKPQSESGAAAARPGTQVGQATTRGVVFPVESDPEPKAPDDRPRWGLAPIAFRWSGNTSLDLTRQFSSGGDGSLQRLSITSLNGSAASYVWQPYIAQVNGNLGVTLANAATEGGGSRDLGLNGGGRVTVFPFSRFPFEAYLDKTDSRTSGELTTATYENLRFGARQTYRTEDGAASYVGNYDRNLLTSSGVQDTLDMVQFSMNRRDVLWEKTHSFTGAANYTRNAHEGLPAASAFNLGATHSFRPEDHVSLQNDASFSGSTFLDSRSRIYQLNSTLTWTPPDMPLVASGSARLSGFDVGSGSTSSKTNSLTVGGNATYAYTRNLNFSGGASVSAVTDQDVSTAQFLGVSYQADPRDFRGFAYTMGASATASNQTGTASAQNLAGLFNHGLTKVLPEFVGGSLSLTGTQSVSTGLGTGQTGTPNSLTHSLSAGWSRFDGASQTSVIGSASDQRNFGGGGEAYQVLSLQGTRSTFLSRLSSMAASLSFQASRRERGAEGDATSAITNGIVSYQNNQFFGVPRLTFTSILSANLQDISDPTVTAAGSGGSGRNLSWENFARYKIGRTDFQLRAQVARAQGASQGVIFFRMSRELGN